MIFAAHGKHSDAENINYVMQKHVVLFHVIHKTIKYQNKKKSKRIKIKIIGLRVNFFFFELYLKLNLHLLNLPILNVVNG